MTLSSIEIAQLYTDLPPAGSYGRRVYVVAPANQAGTYTDTGAAWVRASYPGDESFNAIAGWTGQNFPIYNTSSLALTAGAVRYTLIPMRKGDTISTLYFAASVIPATITTIKAGLSTTAGARLAASANTTGAWTTTGIGTFAMATAYTATASGWVYATFLSDSTTAGTLRAGATATGFDGVAGPLGVATSGVETSQTDLDATATITAGTQPLWVAWA